MKQISELTGFELAAGLPWAPLDPDLRVERALGV